MRILFILEYYYPHIGGVETFFKTLAESLDEQGHQVTILTNKYEKDLPAISHFGNGIKVIRHNYFNRYGFTFLSWRHAIKLARSADLIHTTSYNAAIPAWIAAKMTKTKSVITFHERWGKLWFKLPWMSLPSKFVHYLFERVIVWLHFDRFVGVSEFTKNALIDAGVKQNHVARIYNGIRYEEFDREALDIPTREIPSFLYFGRVGVAKGLDVLINAYERLTEIRKDHQLILVIPSEETALSQAVRKMVAERGLSAYVHYKHDLSFDQLKELICSVHAVVVASYSEGFCFAAVESQALGTPVISAGTGALREVVGGKHITLKDHKATLLTEAMSRSLEDDWDNSPSRKFELTDTITQYMALYDEIRREH